MDNIISLTALQLAEKIKKQEITAKEAVEAVYHQIENVEEEYHCYITLNKEAALKKARKIDEKIQAGTFSGRLAGVPVAIKDNLCTKGLRTTCASKMLDSFIPSYTAQTVERLEEEGAIIIGKTNMDEFAMGSTTETSVYGNTGNPRDSQYSPGGSSGGSAAAVAAAECFFALGSDTGGSIRQPASHCGVVGLKPTYGTVSRYGLIAYGSSLEQIGPLCKDVADAATILEILAGQDKKDSTSIKRADTNFASALKKDVKGMRIGIPKDYFTQGLDEDVRKKVLVAANLLREQGAIVEEFDLGFVEYAIPAYYIIASAEASSNLERFDGVKYGYRNKDAKELHRMYKKTRAEGFGIEVKRRIMIGAYVLSSGYYDQYYLKALKVKAKIKQAFKQAFEKYDVILGPVAPSTAPKLGESLKDPMQMYLGDIYTVAANLAGLPAMSIPCGTDKNGLPVGLHLMADCFEEKKMIQAAYTYEKCSKELEEPENGKNQTYSHETSGGKES